MSAAPTLPTFNTGAVSSTQLNSLVTGVTYATGLAQKLANIAVFASAGGCTLSTTSASYVDIVNATTSWTKLGDGSSSNVLILVALDIYSSGAGSTGGKVGVSIGGTDTDVMSTFHSGAGTIGGSFVGFKTIASVAAGAYTPKLRALRSSGTGTLTVDGLVNVSFLLGELPL